MANHNEQQELFEHERTTEVSGSAEPLGMTFESDDARRAHFLEKLKEKLPELRRRADFPVAEDEDILQLSEPIFYTACPNPFLEEFVRHYSEEWTAEETYERQPYTGPMRASTRHPVYNFHPYPTKVPPDIIRTLIEHYSRPGDLVFDGFCGTGMTGVAARESGRHAVLNDLSPLATFIAAINTQSHDWKQATCTLQEILKASQAQWGYLYETRHGSRTMPVNYYVWSDVFTCPECMFEFPFFPHGVIHHGNKVETRRAFPCPSCDAELNVRRVERVLTREGKKRQLVWVNAGAGKTRISREPTTEDIDLARDIERMKVSSWFPTDPVNLDGYSAKLAQLGDKAITEVSRFLSKRNLLVLADLWERAGAVDNASIRRLILATLTSVFTVISERQGYFGGGGGMSGNLYMPIVRMEKSIYDVVQRKLKKLKQAEQEKDVHRASVAVTTESATSLPGIPDNSIDYIYTDPPFGANIIYTEMNLLLEAWLKVTTNERNEAVIDETRERDFDAYAELMRLSFIEFHRILKPGRWMTVEFHNTKASVWNLIQNAIGESGFVVAQVGVLDKGSTTILADIRPGAAKQDLLISAYKPNHGLEERFKLESGTEDGVWDFLRTHLRQLPVFLAKDGQAEVIAERQSHLLFDKVVAFHVQRGVTVPMSAGDTYAGLAQRFPERDGMYFLPDQVAEYDRYRMTVEAVLQVALFVKDEGTAIQWLKQQLTEKPQTFQELHPQFIKELTGWDKHERQLELLDLLEENFLRYDGQGEVPSQVHSYLSSNFKDLRNLDRDEPSLRAKVKDCWYVPDSRKAADLELLRERALLREFAECRDSTQRRLTVFRFEAVRAGFRRAWQDRDYTTIITVARKIPESVLQEDPKLLMWFDQAITRAGDCP